MCLKRNLATAKAASGEEARGDGPLPVWTLHEACDGI